MPNFTKLTTESELPPADEAREFPCGEKMICVANVNGTFSAMDNVCLHRGGPLGQGMIEGEKLFAPGTAGHGIRRPAQPSKIPAQKSPSIR